jgi:phosphoribosylamine--glycine ligase
MASKFLLVGNGAREHAIAQALCRRKDVVLYAYMSARNPGIEALCRQSGGSMALGNIHAPAPIAEWAMRMGIELAFPSPDAVLAAGVTDELLKRNIRVAAPTKAASRIEWDKAFLRQLMEQGRVSGCPKYGFFKSTDGLDGFIDSMGGLVAVKPVGLTGGKGVAVVGSQLKDGEEAKSYARAVLTQNIGGQGVIIEERLEGEEFTLQAFCDGRALLPMPAVQDHKRANVGDTGSNTGGMGSYSGGGHLLPFLSQTHYEEAFKIMQKVARILDLETNIRFQGVMYGQFMLTRNGIYLIEINARFGDPEAINVLALLKTPLADVFERISQGGHLNKMKIRFRKEASVVKYLVPEGYPAKAATPSLISIDAKKLKSSKAELYYATVDQRPDGIYTSTSRSIAVLGLGNTIAEAEKKAEAGCAAVSGPVWHRPDIGTKELIEKKIEHIKQLRSGSRGG